MSRPIVSRVPMRSWSSFGLTAVAAVCAVLVVSPASGQIRDPAVPHDAARRVDELVAHYGADTPGGVVAVVQGGEVIFVRAYGLANLEQGVPMTPGTLLDLGSVSKQFTGFAIALLAERGELMLDDDIRTHLADVPDFGHTITVRHLLHHTSGLREIFDSNILAGFRPGDGFIQADALHLTSRMRALNFEPGSRYLYSNTGYALLADIVAAVSGMSFPEFMARNVFAPLGMAHTDIMDVPGELIPGAAGSYELSPRSDIEKGIRRYVRVFDNSGLMGAGGIYTTVDDLAAWMGNFRSGAVGGTAVLERMLQRGVLTDGDTLDYAFGITVSEWRGQPLLLHNGTSAGYRSGFLYLPAMDAGVITLSNDAGFRRATTADVLEAFFGGQVTEEPVEPAPPPSSESAVVVDPAVLESYVARYELDTGTGSNIVLEDGRLVEQVQEWTTPMLPTSDSTFTSGGGVDYVFHRNSEGDVTGLTVTADGERWELARIAAWAPTPDDLVALEGRYFSPELETVYTLSVRDGKLVARHRRNADIELTPVGADLLSGAHTLDRVKLERNQAGDVVGFYVTTGRVVDLWFERMEPSRDPALRFQLPSPTAARGQAQ